MLPAVVVAAYPAGLIARMVRAQVLDTVGETHVQMVRALGFRERAVFGRFAMKLAWNPVAAAVALVFGYSLVNTFLVEAIFDWPGLGSYATASIVHPRHARHPRRHPVHRRWSTWPPTWSWTSSRRPSTRGSGCDDRSARADPAPAAAVPRGQALWRGCAPTR